MDRKMKEGLIGTMDIVAFALACAAAAFNAEPALQRFGFDPESMTNKIVAGTIIVVGVMVPFMLMSYVARRIILPKDK